MIVELYPSWENILEELSNLFCFQFEKLNSRNNDVGQYKNGYTISDMCFARKADLDNFIINSSVGSSEYARATVLYSLYACRYLTITDIKYPTYQDWKNKYNLSLDHKLPRFWFPRLTFDCTNWKPMSLQNNKNKGDNFLDEGVERLEWLSTKIKDIKSKYL